MTWQCQTDTFARGVPNSTRQFGPSKTTINKKYIFGENDNAVQIGSISQGIHNKYAKMYSMCHFRAHYYYVFFGITSMILPNTYHYGALNSLHARIVL